jgi:hypothetical protein
MVRADVVTHPSQWRWCGYDELVGQRERYRLLDFDRLLQSLGVSSLTDYRLLQEQGIEEAIQRQELKRQAAWSEALAVGNQQFVERVTGIYEARQKYVYTEASIATDLSTWTIREESLPYHIQG